MEERIVTKTQKKQECSSLKLRCSLFLMSMELSTTKFLPRGQTINQHIYKNILRRLMHSLREKRRELWETRSWLLHYDNAPAHNALGIREFLAKNNIVVPEQSPYSPDLAPCDFFCFSNLRKSSKELVSKIQKPLKKTVMRELQAFQECVEAWQ